MGVTEAQTRLAGARSTHNRDLTKALEEKIVAGERLRDRMISQIVGQFMTPPMAILPEATVSESCRMRGPSASAMDKPEGVDPVWNQLTRVDLQQIKRELDERRAEMLARHAEELKAIESETAEIDTLEQANRQHRAQIQYRQCRCFRWDARL